LTEQITTEQIEAYRISPQQAHLFMRQRNQREPLLAQCVIRLDGPLDLNVLQKALTQVVTRHAILRTRFVRPEAIKLPLQVISDDARFDWRVLDAKAIEAAGVAAVDTPAIDAPDVEDVERLCRTLLEEESARAFDLENGPVLHAALVSLSAEQHLLALSVPALCADTRTLHNLFRELSAAYVRSPLNEDENAEEAVQYLQFSEWQNEVLADEEAEAGKQYWHSQEVSGAPDLRLPFPAPRGAGEGDVDAKDTVGARGCVRVALNAGAAEMAQALGLSEEVLLLSCWQALVWRLSGKSGVVTGQAQDGRKYEELKDALGSFARALPLRTEWPEGMTLAEAAREVAERVGEGRQWQEYFSWERAGSAAMEALSARSAGVGYEYEQRPEVVEAAGVSFYMAAQEVACEGEAVKLKCVRAGDELWAEVSYEQGIYQEGGMRVLAEQMREVVESAVGGKGETKIEDLEMLAASHRQLLIDLNRTRKEYASDRSIHQLIEEQVARTPEQIAVVDGERQLSYRELNSRANQLAHHLRILGVGPETLVAIYMERSTEMVVSLLGVLKAGGAYVPLDTMYPYERLCFVMADAKVSVLLTQDRMMARLPDHQAQVIYLDSEWPTVATQSEANPAGNVTESNAAYVLYTSGSTGMPKGVVIPHRGLVNYLSWCTEAYEVALGLGAPVHSPLGFDLTVTSIFSPLLAGQSLRLISEEAGIEGLTGALRVGENFSLLKITPPHLEVLNQMLEGDELAGRVRVLVVGGEALSNETLSLWRNNAPQTRLINEYGPTETVVGCCVYEVSGDDPPTGAVPIGRPIANTEIYVLDGQLRPVALGVAGELYIGGDGLARGYLDHPDLTAEKFIPHPYAASGGARLYRTGDLARLRADGEIEYLGRTDHQVKVRGYRIELGEIEAVIRQHPEISEVVVLAREDVVGDKRIVAYLVTHAPEQISLSDIRRFLRDKLPEYMVPSSLVTLKTLPLTPNGKVDRDALPAPGLGRAGIEEVYLAPRTALEEVIAAIWAETIGIERVGVHDNFFELGGHSLLATQVISRIRDEFEVELPVRLLFEGMTVEEMALAMVSREAVAGQSEKIARAMKAVEEMGEGEFLEMLQQKRESNESKVVQ
jgi:amino acid adenylation domain-containing protein